MTRWEFWPPWAFYPPVVLYIFYIGLKHRSLTLFTCANPAIEEGGFIGESKSAILAGLGQRLESQPFIARALLLEKSRDDIRSQRALEFMRERALSFPVVLKPDAGERGAGVAVIRTERQLTDYLKLTQRAAVIIQEHVPGLKFGVFYYRYPNSEQGQIFSITRKLFPTVVGDGESSLEKLILKDDRAVALARAYFDAQSERLWEVPARGESVQLIEIGTHCLGSIFLDGIEIKTAAMEAAIDKLAKGFAGFYFGRFDIRTPALAEFQEGRNFKVVELNGVTS